MKFLELFKNEKALVDDDDYKHLSSFSWHKEKDGYVRRCYKSINGVKSKRLHREIMGIEDKNIHIDHINGNKLDNRRENLRICTRSQNMANSKLHSNNTTGFKGVHLFKKTGKYTAHTANNGKKIHLGYFNTSIEAAVAYNKKALELFGQFARLNNV